MKQKNMVVGMAGSALGIALVILTFCVRDRNTELYKLNAYRDEMMMSKVQGEEMDEEELAGVEKDMRQILRSAKAKGNSEYERVVREANMDRETAGIILNEDKDDKEEKDDIM